MINNKLYLAVCETYKPSSYEFAAVDFRFVVKLFKSKTCCVTRCTTDLQQIEISAVWSDLDCVHSTTLIFCGLAEQQVLEHAVCYNNLHLTPIMGICSVRFLFLSGLVQGDGPKSGTILCTPYNFTKY